MWSVGKRANVNKNAMPTLRIPVATYRLQFNHLFRFADALRIVEYLADLGITDIYSSPYLKAKKGSLHGYDIVDHSSINPEIGTEEEYDNFTDKLRTHGMGLILDFVPNHMCLISEENLWWMDVLENGPSSRHAHYFDINWEPIKKELKNKVLLPFLGGQYGAVLEKQELKLFFKAGAFFITYYDNIFPVEPKTYLIILEYGIDKLKELTGEEDLSYMEFTSILTSLKNLPSYLETAPEKIDERYREKEIAKKRLGILYEEDDRLRCFIDKNIEIFNGTPEDRGSFDLLDSLMREQVYRLSHWPVATDEINYRRFFDINSLGAIRMEDPYVFRETHNLIFKLVGEKKITGLRIDHPDGLYNPSEYLTQLQYHCYKSIMAAHVEKLRLDISLPYDDTFLENEILTRFDDMMTEGPGNAKPFYIVGEKILIKSERMPEEWPIFSTTGYVFLNSLNGIFIDGYNAKIMDTIYSRFVGGRTNYQELVHRNKKLIMETAMASEINNLGHYLNRISERNRHTRDFTLNSLTNAIAEVIACFPVYRTYINDSSRITERDRQQINLAVSKARRMNPAVNSSIFDFLQDILLGRYPDEKDESGRKESLDFIMRFQQMTGPVMAKGLEDTTFYIYNRLLSLNEVGGSPERFGTTMETFHGQNIERHKYWPHALIATSTHDSKRGEDVRARINVLSEIPDLWKTHLLKWVRANKSKKLIVDSKPVPDRNEEYYFYQTLIGTWPMTTISDDEYEIYRKRINDHMVKSIREAKINTSWINPNSFYEEALLSFVNSIMLRASENEFLKDFIPFQSMIAQFGIYNSLSQALLKIASPGVPDLYQGAELWNLTLADPDNRGLVDFEKRIGLLSQIKIETHQGSISDFAHELTKAKEDGRIKLYLTYKALNYRKSNRALFEGGEYIFLEVHGKPAENICAFMRRSGKSAALCIVPRFLSKIVKNDYDLPFGVETWGDAVVCVPADGLGKRYRNVFTGESVTVDDHEGITGIAVAEIFKHFPVALLDKIDS